MATCAACREAYDGFARAMEAVQSLPRLEAEPGFTEAVLARLRRGERRVAGAERARRAPWPLGAWDWGLRPALAAAALAVVVGVGAYVTWDAHRAPGTSVARSAAGLTSRTAPEAKIAPAPSAPGGVASSSGLVVMGNAAQVPSARSPLRAGASRSLASTARRAPAMAVGTIARRGAGDGSVPDTLFDHSYDLEFAVDHVDLRHAPGDQNLRPARPIAPSEVGRKASITF
jgi:hypothetical protein